MEKIEKLKKLAFDLDKSFAAGFTVGLNVGMDFKKKNIFACGMGGSILAAEILNDYFVSVSSGVVLPKTSSPDNLLGWFFSYSGETEETLLALAKAKELGFQTFGFGRGGLLKTKADVFFETPDFLMPRFAVPYYLGLIQAMLTKTEKQINIDTDKILARLQSLSERMRDKMLLVYAPPTLHGLAHFWEVNFDETSKTPCFIGEIPDIDHHDIASFSRKNFKDNFFAIFLKDKEFLAERTEKTFEIFKDSLLIDSERIVIDQAQGISGILEQLLLAYLLSLNLAECYQVDPFENYFQEKLKKDLKS